MKFLRHIERTRTLAYVIPVDVEDPQAEYRALKRELTEYSRGLSEKPHAIVVSKVDLLPPGDEPPPTRVARTADHLCVHLVSSR